MMLLAGTLCLPAQDLTVSEIHRYTSFEKPYEPNWYNKHDYQGLISSVEADPGTCFVVIHCQAPNHANLRLQVGTRLLGPYHRTHAAERAHIMVFNVPDTTQSATLILPNDRTGEVSVPVDIPTEASKWSWQKPGSMKPRPYETINGTVRFIINKVRETESVRSPGRLQLGNKFLDLSVVPPAAYPTSNSRAPKNDHLIFSRPRFVTLALDLELSGHKNKAARDLWGTSSLRLGGSPCLQVRMAGKVVEHQSFGRDLVGSLPPMSITCYFLVPEDIKTFDLMVDRTCVARCERP